MQLNIQITQMLQFIKCWGGKIKVKNHNPHLTLTCFRKAH